MLNRQQLEQIRETVAQAMQTEMEEDQKHGEQGKYTMILDTAANPSYISDQVQVPTKLTNTRTIQTPNGQFLSNRAVMITLKKKTKPKKAEAIVHRHLPKNLLSTTPIVKDIGPIILADKGAAVLTGDVYNKVKHKLDCFANRRNNLYEVQLNDSTICLSAHQEKDRISTNQNAKLVAKVDANGRSKTNGTTITPIVQTRNTGKEARFTLPTKTTTLEKKPIHKWHLILNHAHPKVLTTMAKNPYLKHPEITQIKTGQHMSCRGCLEGK